MSRQPLFLFSLALVAGLLAGCGSKSGPGAPDSRADNARPSSAAPEIELTKIKPNEAGLVPILEYHDITPGESRWARSRQAFRADLERLYAEGYRPVSMSDYLNNRIDLPPGKSPVILTFDDAVRGQFYYEEDGSISPDSAFGILKEFHEKHPDWKLRGVFYILPESAFGGAQDRARKVQALRNAGFEIGNHTVSHGHLGRMSDAEVQKELGGAVSKIQELSPGTRVESIALPFGEGPRNAQLLRSGQHEGVTYKHKAALLVGANPAPSPAAKKFEPMRLPRIQAIGGDFGIDYWLDYLRRNSDKRYVSDGDPQTVTVPRDRIGDVDETRLQGAKLRVYDVEGQDNPDRPRASEPG